MVWRISMASTVLCGSGAMPAGAFATMLILCLVEFSVSHFGIPTGCQKLARFQACAIRLARGTQVAVTRPPDSKRGDIVILSLQGQSITATSNCGGGRGGRPAATPGGFGEGCSFTLSTARTGRGTFPNSSFSPDRK